VQRAIPDFKYAVRVLLKSPGFAVVSIVVLALGIGANTAIFSVVNGVLLRPLPFEDPERVVQIWHVPPAKSFPGMTKFAVSAANYLDWRSQNHVFEQTAIYTGASYNLTGKGEPVSVPAATVEPSFFSVLGIRPIHGRSFVEAENQPGSGNVVILSHAFWQNHFGSDENIVGQKITLNSASYTVVGVMPSNFRSPSWAQIWTPLAWTDKDRAVRGEHHYLVLARLKAGVDLKQAQAEMNTISRQLEQQYPEDDKGWGAVIVPLREEMVGQVRPALWVLLGAVAFVLFIACANIANLVLARMLARRKEIAIRAALGANRAQLLYQLLTETTVLALAGGALGLIVAHYGVALIVRFLADKLPRSAEIRLDGWVLAFTFLISLLSGIVAGLVPALRLTKADLNEALKHGMGRTDADAGSKRTRDLLVISEVGLSLILLIGAGLMIRSLWMLRGIDPGINPHHLLTMTVAVSSTTYATPLEQSNFFDQVLERVRSLPGVASAGVIDDLPLSNSGSHQPIRIEGRPAVPMSEQPEVDVRMISTGYMSAMQVPVLRGRDFSDSDTADRPAAILISQSFAKRFWPNEDPIGKRLTMSFFPNKIRQVAGVVGDVKLDTLAQRDSNAALYFPLSQVSVPLLGGWRSFPMSLVVRTSSPPATLMAAVTNAVHQVNPELPVVDITTMDEFISDTLSPERFNMLLLAAFAGVALVLAVVGIYSVLSYAVKRRLREIGIRMALGAQIGDVLRLIVVEGMKPALIGMLAGLCGAIALGRVISTLIYGVRPIDPITFGTVSLVLASTAFFASMIPAYRATGVDPSETLHDE
jgi:putative ABC transport system permease protein